MGIWMGICICSVSARVHTSSTRCSQWRTGFAIRNVNDFEYNEVVSSLSNNNFFTLLRALLNRKDRKKNKLFIFLSDGMSNM